MKGERQHRGWEWGCKMKSSGLQLSQPPVPLDVWGVHGYPWCGCPRWCEHPCPASGLSGGLVDTVIILVVWKIPPGYCVGDTCTETQREEVATLSCKAVPQICHISVGLLTWITLLIVPGGTGHGLGCSRLSAKCMQHARPVGICILFVWSTECEKACKTPHRLFGY